MFRPLSALALGLSLAMTARAADTGFLTPTYRDPAGTEYKYVLFVPHGYKSGEPTPTILFLHGAGETKGGAKMPVEVGLGPAIKKREKTFPFLTIIPQAPVRGWQAGGESAKMALGILADVEKQYSVDPKRVYLTGLSMGGYGTWSLAAADPGKWAAVAPVCGGVRGGEAKAAAEKVKDIPAWIFHGDKDQAVPVARSREMAEALKELGADYRYTEYAGVDHNSWDRAYGTDELYAWMLRQVKK